LLHRTCRPARPAEQQIVGSGGRRPEATAEAVTAAGGAGHAISILVEAAWWPAVRASWTPPLPNSRTASADGRPGRSSSIGVTVPWGGPAGRQRADDSATGQVSGTGPDGAGVRAWSAALLRTRSV